MWFIVIQTFLCPHLSTEAQSLIGRLDVICYYEEHLLALKKEKSGQDNELDKQKVKLITLPGKFNIVKSV